MFEKRRRILERMGGVGVEESAAVGAQHLDGFLRRHRALRDGLLRPFERGRHRVRVQILDHALRAENQRRDDRDRHQNIQGGARQSAQKLPIVFTDWRANPRTSAMAMASPAAADSEIMHRQPGHLDEVTQVGFGRIALPVRVGDETDRRVEAGVRTYIARAETLRIKRQPDLQPLHGIQKTALNALNASNAPAVAGPVLLLRFAVAVESDAAEPVNQALQRARAPGVRKFRLALNDGRDKRARAASRTATISRKKIAICIQPLAVMNSPLPRPTTRTSPASEARTGGTRRAPAKSIPQSGIPYFPFSSLTGLSVCRLELVARQDHHPGHDKKSDDQQTIDDVRHSWPPGLPFAALR